MGKETSETHTATGVWTAVRLERATGRRYWRRPGAREQRLREQNARAQAAQGQHRQAKPVLEQKTALATTSDRRDSGQRCCEVWLPGDG